MEGVEEEGKTEEWRTARHAGEQQGSMMTSSQAKVRGETHNILVNWQRPFIPKTMSA